MPELIVFLMCIGGTITLLGIGIVIGRATRHKIKEEFIVVRRKHDI